jgi:hypothetical protein
MQVETDNIQIRSFFYFVFPHYFCAHFCVGDDGDVVSITLPPSRNSRTVTVTRGTQTTNRVCVTENLPSGPPALICLSQQIPTCSNTSAINISPARATPSLYNECPARSPDTRGMLSSSDVSSISLDALHLGSHVDTLENTPSSVPSHLRERPLAERFCVSKEMVTRYPPFRVGWRKQSWVVVIRGRDIGIFHDFWYVFRMVPVWSNADLYLS